MVLQEAEQQGFGTYGLGALITEPLDAGDSSGDHSLMNYGAIADPDGPAIEVRGETPLRGRGWLVALFAVALAADFGMRFGFDRMIGSPPWEFWLLTATEWIGGLCALLIPVAVVARTPDAWISRRALFLGVLLGAAAEMLAAAGEGVIALNWWLLPTGMEPALRFPLTQGIYLSERLVGIAAALLIGTALVKARTRPVPRRAWPWLGGILLVAAVAWLLAPGGAGVIGPAILTAAVLVAGTLAGTYRLWAVLAGLCAAEPPRRPWALAGAGAVVSIIASVTLLAIIDWNVGGEPAVVGVATAATASAILTLLAFADGLGART
jgi:TM2 domain-containing membrane protein YozV